jgi:hypothetical protein
MADVLKRLVGPLQLANATATVYTVPAATTTTIRSIHIVNTTGGSVSFYLSIGADAVGTRLYSAYTVGAGDVYDWTGSIVLNATEVLAAHASAATSLTAVVSGVESA